MRGDVLFVKPGSPQSDPFGTLIASMTNGPYCHVGIDLGDGQYLSAMSQNGIQPAGYPAPGMYQGWLIDLHTTQPQIDVALEWAISETGTQYGYVDLVAHLLKMTGVPFSIGQAHGYDCSDFVSRYLMLAGINLGALIDDLNAVSPNDLARALKVI